ncbi:large ribosomal subunit protein eL21-like [Muntiacus reevesi]|uniref:large ribosomal subunit protein eL21-like n=1 Tax=Muntiacus reevesi TaxID=9886 RepID=UPI003306EAF0
MTNTKGQAFYTFSRPFRKGVVPLATSRQIYKKGDNVDIKGMDTFQKVMSHKCYHGKTRRAYSVTQHAVGITVNKQVKGRFPAKRINVPLEGIKHSKSGENVLKHVKENDQKKKEAKEKVQAKENDEQEGTCPVIETGMLKINGQMYALLDQKDCSSALVLGQTNTKLCGDDNGILCHSQQDTLHFHRGW